MNVFDVVFGKAHTERRMRVIKYVVDFYLDVNDISFDDDLPNDLIELKRQAKSEKDYNDLIDTIYEIESTIIGYDIFRDVIVDEDNITTCLSTENE